MCSSDCGRLCSLEPEESMTENMSPNICGLHISPKESHWVTASDEKNVVLSEKFYLHLWGIASRLGESYHSTLGLECSDLYEGPTECMAESVESVESVRSGSEAALKVVWLVRTAVL